MGLFSRSNPFDEDIEYATSESNLSDNWALFLSVCDKIDNTNGEADACSSLIKRLTHSNQRISCQAVSLLNAAVINCSKFKEYVCTHKPAMDAIEIVARRNYRDKSGISMREMMAKWCFEFKTSSEMNNMRALYYKLKGEGFTFPDVEADMARQEQKKQALKDQENWFFGVKNEARNMISWKNAGLTHFSMIRVSFSKNILPFMRLTMLKLRT